MLKEETNNCAELAEKILEQMCLDGYSRKNVYSHIKSIYNKLVKYCDAYFEGRYSVKAGESFMVVTQMKNQSKQHTDLVRNSIKRLDHALTGDFHWRPTKVRLKPYATSCYDEIVRRYETYLIQTGKTITNTRHHIHLIARFLSHMESIGITDLSMIKAENVHERFIAANDKEGFHKSMKIFFRYACKYGLIENDISLWIPSAPRRKPVPSVYTVEEIERILSVIDRSTDLGKRNYCIVLMAAKLGIRSCDIAALKIDDIQRTEGIIRVVQQKTDIPVAYPILDEISTALEDYLNNARPKSPLPNVFLTKPRPVASVLSTQGIYAIVSGAIAKSGIDTSSRRHGAHALRSSLASQLLAEGKSYPEIQQVLGQTSPDVARHYIRVETERLRECAIGVPGFSNEIVDYFLERR
ncbi:MAG: tyrosine-type recombinase/integrase [Oscillospiraceae bacterium]|nr:tyrosine-type recombinase/integrase [Oscillospiraceae bacterium]